MPCLIVRRPVRLNFRLIRGRSAAAGTVRSVLSCLVTHASDYCRTVSNRIGERVGETLKSSNLLSSASGLTREDRSGRQPPDGSAGSPVSFRPEKPPGSPSAASSATVGMRWHSPGRRGIDAAAGQPMSAIDRMIASASAVRPAEWGWLG
jgi:hypothetical protein